MASAAGAASAGKVHFKAKNIILDLDCIAAARTDGKNQLLELHDGHLRLSMFGHSTRDAKRSTYSFLGNIVCGATQTMGEQFRGVVTDQKEVLRYLGELVTSMERFYSERKLNYFEAQPALTERVIESLKSFSDEGSAQKETLRKKQIETETVREGLSLNIDDMGSEYRSLAVRVEALAKKSEIFVKFRRDLRKSQERDIANHLGAAAAGPVDPRQALANRLALEMAAARKGKKPA
ncbi:MAG: hypothetical protein K1060chlam5_01306 [Candidatus Anoxychlamydiales bacterium]|nr:hypothetical protein [Candidatus Anoxychlamydiales bacterium]